MDLKTILIMALVALVVYYLIAHNVLGLQSLVQ